MNGFLENVVVWIIILYFVGMFLHWMFKTAIQPIVLDVIVHRMIEIKADVSEAHVPGEYEEDRNLLVRLVEKMSSDLPSLNNDNVEEYFEENRVTFTEAKERLEKHPHEALSDHVKQFSFLSSIGIIFGSPIAYYATVVLIPLLAIVLVTASFIPILAGKGSRGLDFITHRLMEGAIGLAGLGRKG